MFEGANVIQIHSFLVLTIVDSLEEIIVSAVISKKIVDENIIELLEKRISELEFSALFECRM